jgi:hypothetical protein
VLDTNHEDVMDQTWETVQTGAMYAPQMLEDYILTAGRAFLGVFTAPAELALRRNFNTQAIHPITYVAGWFALQIITIVGVLIPSPGTVGLGTIYGGFLALSAFHAWRLYPRFRNMDLEDDGEAEGPVWPVFHHLPRAGHFTIRCFYEPVSIGVAAIVLNRLGLLNGPATLYIAFVSLCLCVRACLRWYEIWRYVRNMRNNKHRALVMAHLLDGKLSAEQVLDSLDFTSLPVNMPQPVRARVERVLEPAFAALKSPSNPA